MFDLWSIRLMIMPKSSTTWHHAVTQTEQEWHNQMWCVTARINELEKQEKRCLKPGVRSVFQNHQPLFKLPWRCSKKSVIVQEVKLWDSDSHLSSTNKCTVCKIIFKCQILKFSVMCRYLGAADPKSQYVNTLACQSAQYVIGVWKILQFMFG